MDDRRASPRRRTLLEGHIEIAGGGAIDCTIRNLSDGGARLLVVSVIGVPDEFVLSFGAAAERRSARVVWRKETELGVAFVGA
ncbi:PilZ domain-containing protein [Methylobacterium sp. J-048]|uniref:PilZ domain-containing protein n=1 Tax=Methylobacterium sp. J-048 TaxID=2836635 RepID=UPI001FBA8782|nr:PilZ domain-containing protein [Methylobacterium sp. J-048]MCJ2055498.1 PilZ domain-containing protein [Methylobacterium sp. J-048]